MGGRRANQRSGSAMYLAAPNVVLRGCFCKEWLQKFSAIGLLNGWQQKHQENPTWDFEADFFFYGRSLLYRCRFLCQLIYVKKIVLIHHSGGICDSFPHGRVFFAGGLFTGTAFFAGALEKVTQKIFIPIFISTRLPCQKVMFDISGSKSRCRERCIFNPR